MYKAKSNCIKDSSPIEAIISREDFETVQVLLGMDTRVAPDKSEVYLFSGVAVCGDCGRQMSRKVSTVAGKKYVYYMCSANKREGKCTSHRIREEELEAAVMECLNFRLEKLTEMKGILEYIGTLPMQAGDVKRLEMRMLQLEEEAQKYEGLKVSVYEDLKDGLLDKEEHLSIKQEFDSRKKAALDSIAHLRQEMECLTERNGRRHEWIESFVKYRGIRSLVRSVAVELIEEIRIYEDKRIEVKFRYEDQYLEMLDTIENAGRDFPGESEREVS